MKSHFSKNVFSSSRKAMTSLFFDCILRKILITSGKDIHYQLIVGIQINHLSRTERTGSLPKTGLQVKSDFLELPALRPLVVLGGVYIPILIQLLFSFFIVRTQFIYNLFKSQHFYLLKIFSFHSAPGRANMQFLSIK